MSVVELLLVVILLLFVFRGGIRSGRPLWTRGKPIVRDDPIRLILFVILSLLLIGFLVRLSCHLVTTDRLQGSMRAKFHRPQRYKCKQIALTPRLTFLQSFLIDAPPAPRY